MTDLRFFRVAFRTPLPQYVWFVKQCPRCGKKFLREKNYRTHYQEYH